jgi:hypothetical protein
MKYFIFFILNILSYFLLLFIIHNIFNNKYVYPFRKLEIYNFLFNILIFCSLAFFYFNKEMLLATIILNTNLLYIMFHSLNMINTSPRTKILLTLYENKNIKKYNETILLNNRIKRLLSNNQIIIKNNIVKINENKKIFLFVNFIFKLIKKI